MKIDILTLFPKMFDGFLSESIIKRAIDNGIVSINIHNFSINDCSMTLQQKNQDAIVKEDNGKVFFKID